MASRGGGTVAGDKLVLGKEDARDLKEAKKLNRKTTDLAVKSLAQVRATVKVSSGEPPSPP